jgi:hypothetical protein
LADAYVSLTIDGPSCPLVIEGDEDLSGLCLVDALFPGISVWVSRRSIFIDPDLEEGGFEEVCPFKEIFEFPS